MHLNRFRHQAVLVLALVLLAGLTVAQDETPTDPPADELQPGLLDCAEHDNDIARLQCFDAAIATCVNEENDIARLQCFDAFASVPDLAPPEPEAAAPEAQTVPESDAGSESTQELDPAPESDQETESDESNEKVAAEDSSLPEFLKKRRPTDPKKIIEADEKMVENCEFLGTVVGKSGWGGLAARAASRGSMRGAKKQAAKLGATHIVLGDFTNARGGWGPTVSTTQARAYACDD